jgi:ParB family transcriptional regulator, chromosome partitioning protein
MAKKTSLGRGFEALIPQDLDVSILEEDKDRIQKLLLNEIEANPDQPRREFDPKALEELTTSIARYGVLQPIIVVRAKNGYRVVAGERRWRAAKAAKLTHVPAIVRSLKELEQLELSLIENVQRVDLSALEQAMSVYRLQQQFNMSLEEIAKRLSKAPSTLSNLTRLLGLPESAREALRQGKISEGHARAVLALKGDSAKQEELLRSIIDNGWTVRQAEQFAVQVKKMDRGSKEGRSSKQDAVLIDRLNKQFGVSVKIRRSTRGGQLIIPFSSESQLDKIIDKFKSEG